jgi:hypothetical protein
LANARQGTVSTVPPGLHAPRAVIPNPLAPFASGVRDLLCSEERQAEARRYVTAKRGFPGRNNRDAPCQGQPCTGHAVSAAKDKTF